MCATKSPHLLFRVCFVSKVLITTLVLFKTTLNENSSVQSHPPLPYPTQYSHCQIKSWRIKNDYHWALRNISNNADCYLDAPNIDKCT